MAAIDHLNRKLKPDAVKFGAMGLAPSWKMRSDYFSQRYYALERDTDSRYLVSIRDRHLLA